MVIKNFSEELKSVFSYITDNLLKRYDVQDIRPEYFILACLEKEDCIAFNILSKIIFDSDFKEIHNLYVKKCEKFKINEKETIFEKTDKRYNGVFDLCVSNANSLSKKMNSENINSGHLLSSILSANDSILEDFKKLNITSSQINAFMLKENNYGMAVEESKPLKHKKKKRPQEDTMKKIIFANNLHKTPITKSSNAFNGLFDIINEKSALGEVDDFLFGEKYYDEAFSIMCKKNKNNVAVVGKSGVGKTLFCENIGNMINRGNCPKFMKDKTIVKVDFFRLFEGTSMRGVFEARVDEIMQEINRNRNYVFFIDDLSSALNSSFSSSDIEKFLDMLLETKYANVIIACSHKTFSNSIMSKPKWNSILTKIELPEPDIENAVEILKNKSEGLSVFHDVIYDDGVFEETVKLCKRYLTDRSLPDSAIDLLDQVSAKISLQDKVPENIVKLRENLEQIEERRVSLKEKSNDTIYDEYDDICREELKVRQELDLLEKAYNLSKKKNTVKVENIKEALSFKTEIPLNDLSVDDKEVLRGMDGRMKNTVIGQDEAIDEVCRSVKRQRVGISNPNKPVVFLFTGHTGVGKTYLAKTLAKELFGKEEQFVKLDMTEYSDKTSATKLIGTGSGYVGYENGGVLTEAIKKKKHCVLLLDEIEKANDEVNNILLPVFDEGRLTDNKGYTVDFKNVIIIMTSNVGAAKIDEIGNGVGFVNNLEEKTKDIIDKEIRKKFKPEFINRIDKIVHFNKLNEEQLSEIVRLEIGKVRKRVIDIGYDFDDTILNGILVDEITNAVKDGKYGARPILRELQTKLEDKIVDYIIDNEIDNGHVFTYDELK